MKDHYSVHLEKTFECRTAEIIVMFKDNSVFRLTGADKIVSDFTNDRSFDLQFTEKGRIWGRFLKISENELILEWNVDGFEKPSERNTVLHIKFTEEDGKCKLVLDHYKIVHKEAAEAKRRGWSEILEEMEAHLNSPNN
ncbi:hypothetical protein BH10BAC5_BH10BAC5_13430 [soil metagenome]